MGERERGQRDTHRDRDRECVRGREEGGRENERVVGGVDVGVFLNA